MLVSEFAEIWSYYFKSNIPMRITLNGNSISLYDLLKTHLKLNEFKLEFKLHQGTPEYNIYSDVYDLNEMPWDIQKIINTLQIETYDNVYNNELILHVKGGE